MISSWMQALRLWGDYWISRCADPRQIEDAIEKQLMTVALTRSL